MFCKRDTVPEKKQKTEQVEQKKILTNYSVCAFTDTIQLLKFCHTPTSSKLKHYKESTKVT